MQSAAIYIRELKGVKDQLQQKNEELKTKILGIDACTDGIKVKFEVANPDSGLDSMIAALRRLKNMDVKAKAIRSSLSGSGLSTTMTIQTKVYIINQLNYPLLASLMNSSLMYFYIFNQTNVKFPNQFHFFFKIFGVNCEGIRVTVIWKFSMRFLK